MYTNGLSTLLSSVLALVLYFHISLTIIMPNYISITVAIHSTIVKYLIQLNNILELLVYEMV